MDYVDFQFEFHYIGIFYYAIKGDLFLLDHALLPEVWKWFRLKMAQVLA